MSGLRKWLFLIVFGAGGLAVLLSLGVWQVQRLAWKQGLNEIIAARSLGDPKPVTGNETAEADDHRAARATGRFAAHETQLRYLTSVKGLGPGFRLIAPFELEDGERRLVDRGFAPERVAPRQAEPPSPPEGETVLVGLLRWPNEASAFTPSPNREDDIWFARDVAAMAAALRTRPVMLVHAPGAPPGGRNIEWPAPVLEKTALSNNHLGYAITWFALAAIWLGMSILWAFRMRS